MGYNLIGRGRGDNDPVGDFGQRLGRSSGGMGVWVLGFQGEEPLGLVGKAEG